MGEVILQKTSWSKKWPCAISSTKDTNGPTTAPRTSSPCQSNNVRKAFWREDSPAVPQLAHSIAVPRYLAMKAKAPTWLCAFNCKPLPNLHFLPFIIFFELENISLSFTCRSYWIEGTQFPR